MLASVVVATHNRADRLRRLLAALEGQTVATEDFEVVVIDDGSADGTSTVLARGDHGLNLITERTAGLGAAAARERGWRLSSGRVVAFTDDDCEPDSGWLAALIDGVESTEKAIVQGRTLPNPAELDRTGPFSRTIRIEELDLNFNTCNIAYPRELLVEIDGFNTEAFGLGAAGEDSDLAWRAIKAGGQAVFREDALTFHAVNQLGPIGRMRVSARSMNGYGLHPELRRASFVHGIFWKPQHLWATRALVALALPRRLWPLSLVLAYPYLRDVWARGRILGGGPALAPYYVLCDLLEISAVVRSGIRYRSPMI